MIKIKEEIEKLNESEKLNLILDLLINETIRYVDISVSYVSYLNLKKKQNETKQRILADCLASKYNKYTDMEFVNARSSLLLYPYVPDEFIKSYVLNGASKKAILEAKKYLKENDVLK